MKRFQLQLMSLCSLLLFVAGSVQFQGCSKANGYDAPSNLIPVTGIVTIDGQPLDYASINFIPKTGTAGLGGYAITDGDGKFTAIHLSSSEGLEPGTYEATFSKITMPDGSPVPAEMDAADAGAIQFLPQHLTEPNPGSNQHILTVTSVPQTVTFELSGKPTRRTR